MIHFIKVTQKEYLKCIIKKNTYKFFNFIARLFEWFLPEWVIVIAILLYLFIYFIKFVRSTYYEQAKSHPTQDTAP